MGQGGESIPTRRNTDKVVNPFGRDLINLCRNQNLVIANGRSIGDADGFCTYYSDNMLGRSSVDLCVVSTSLYPNIGQLVVLPKWECSDHLPVKIGWFASGCVGTQYNGNPARVTTNKVIIKGIIIQLGIMKIRMRNTSKLSGKAVLR